MSVTSLPGIPMYVSCGRDCVRSPCVCCMSWPAGFAAFVHAWPVLLLFPDRRPARVWSGRQGLLRVLWLFPDRRPAECGLAGRVCCVCCGSSLTGDLPSVVWPAGFAACVVALP